MILGNVPAGTCEGGTLRISSVTTLRLREYPNLCYVALETDDGLTGIGETFFGARAVAAWVHETAAAYLLGKDPRTVQRHSRALEGFVGSAGTGTENRGRSAVDIALWDSARPAHRAPALPVAGRPGPGIGPDLQHLRRADLRARVTRLTGPASEQLVEPAPVAKRRRPSSVWAVRFSNGPAPTPGPWPRTCSPKGSRR